MCDDCGTLSASGDRFRAAGKEKHKGMTKLSLTWGGDERSVPGLCLFQEPQPAGGQGCCTTQQHHWDGVLVPTPLMHSGHKTADPQAGMTSCYAVCCNPLCPVLQWHKGFLCSPSANALPGRVDSNQRALSLQGQQPGSRDTCAAISPSLEAWQPLRCSSHPGWQQGMHWATPCLGQDGRGKGVLRICSAAPFSSWQQRWFGDGWSLMFSIVLTHLAGL